MLGDDKGGGRDWAMVFEVRGCRAGWLSGLTRAWGMFNGRSLAFFKVLGA